MARVRRPMCRWRGRRAYGLSNRCREETRNAAAGHRTSGLRRSALCCASRQTWLLRKPPKLAPFYPGANSSQLKRSEYSSKPGPVPGSGRVLCAKAFTCPKRPPSLAAGSLRKGRLAWTGTALDNQRDGSKSKMTSWKFCDTRILSGSWHPRLAARLPAGVSDRAARIQ